MKTENKNDKFIAFTIMILLIGIFSKFFEEDDVYEDTGI